MKLYVPRKVSLFYSKHVGMTPTNESVPNFNMLKFFGCNHDNTLVRPWIDNTVGPGWISDCYETTFCTNCWKALKTVRTY